MKEITLGFGEAPGKKYIFIGAQGDQDPYLWYFWDTQAGNQIPIRDQSLTGYVKSIRIIPRMFKNKWEYKVDVTVSADKEYVIRSGASTIFTKGLLAKLSTFEDLSIPVCIEPKQGSSEKVVFCNLYNMEDSSGVYFEGELPEKVSPLVFDLQAKLGSEVQTTESLEQDKAAYLEREQNYSGPRNGGSSGAQTNGDDYAF